MVIVKEGKVGVVKEVEVTVKEKKVGVAKEKKAVVVAETAVVVTRYRSEGVFLGKKGYVGLET